MLYYIILIALAFVLYYFSNKVTEWIDNRKIPTVLKFIFKWSFRILIFVIWIGIVFICAVFKVSPPIKN